MKYSKKIMKKLTANLEMEGGRKIACKKKFGLIRFELEMPDDCPRLQYFVKVNKKSYLVFAHSSYSVDPKNSVLMVEMAEFVCRANDGIKIGNFELSFETGSIFFECYIDCHSGSLPKKTILSSLLFPAACFAHYDEGFRRVLEDGVTAKEAVEQCDSVYRD